MTFSRAPLQIVFALSLVVVVFGHGRLIDPASRNAAWRFGFGTPKHYTDNELNCGGFSAQWSRNNGKCGVCGDPYDKKNPEFVYPGRYAKDVITKTYKQGQEIDVTVDLTSNHRGFFTFSIGKLGSRPFTNEKLTHVLRQLDGSSRYDLPVFNNQKFTVRLRLPADLSCDRCVLQWRYTAGNNWGCDPDGTCGVGNGKKQETFINCADVKIVS